MDFGLTIEKPQIARKPARRVTRYTVPGRSRDVLCDEGAYDNVEISYQVWCADQRGRDMVLAKEGEISRWLSGGDYEILSDTYDPDYFRMAWCCEPIDPEIILRTHARQELVFSCDPYRYSWAGEELNRWEPAQNAPNIVAEYFNDGCASLPYIKLEGMGSIELRVENGDALWWAFLYVDDFIELDSFTMNTTKAGENRNSKKDGYGYPVFDTGRIVVTAIPQKGAYLTGMEIKPRWRRL